MFREGIHAGGVYSFTVEAGLLFSGTSPSEKQNTCLSGIGETLKVKLWHKKNGAHLFWLQ